MRQVIVVSLTIIIIVIGTSSPPLLYTGHFVAGIAGGREQALHVAKSHGLTLLDTVTWVEQQTLKPRHLKRSLTSTNKVKGQQNYSATWSGFSDPMFPLQWYLRDDEASVHVNDVWSMGLTGQGVTLFVLDDGVQAQNQDIAGNYEPRGGADISEIWRPLREPKPRSTDDSHGTYCAAIMAGVAGNNFCGVGAAFQAKVGGVKLLGSGPISDLQEALALSLWQGVGDIASASWGPKDNGATLDGPGPLARAALRRAISKGRSGRGAILVWAAGNGGLKGDHCNLDGYASSMYTLTVGALTQSGESCPYSEPCAAVLTSVFVRGGQRSNVPSVVVPELDGSCRNNFEGTSAAAPLAAGVIALALQANPSLSWREVQHAVVTSSAPPANWRQDSKWRVNAKGHYFHPQQGFGALHAVKLVREATKLAFRSLPTPRSVSFTVQKMPIMLKGGGTTIVIASGAEISSVEHVVATLTIKHPQRRNLEIFIISPAGTESNILSTRPLDMSNAGFNSWPFLSVNFWGEKSNGKWKLLINNNSTKIGYITHLFFNIYGS